jgi:protein-S-isoprenylcysteine O-methyltransferase Ste14
MFASLAPIVSRHKPSNKVLLALVAVLFVAWLVLMGLDAVRFGWSTVPPVVRGLAAVVLLGSFGLFFLTFSANTFLSPAVRMQAERGQTVISSGPYRFVRHPMYAACALLTLATPLLLGSWFGLVGSALLIGAVGQRAVMEEQVLRRELEGYVDYTRRVRYRLLPFVWCGGADGTLRAATLRLRHDLAGP